MRFGLTSRRSLAGVSHFWAILSILLAFAGNAFGNFTLNTPTPHFTSIDLTWTAATFGTGPYTYQVQRVFDNQGTAGTFDSSTNIGSPTSSTSYTDSGLTISKNYWYQVIAKDSLGATQTCTAPQKTANAFKDAFAGNIALVSNGLGWNDDVSNGGPNQFQGLLYSPGGPGRGWQVHNSQVLVGTMEGVVTVPLSCGSVDNVNQTYVGVLFRWNVADGTGYQFIYPDTLTGTTSGTWYIKKWSMVGGVLTPTTLASVAQARPTSGSHTIQVVVSAASKYITLDGVTVCSTTDDSINATSFPANNQFGLQGSDDDAADGVGFNIAATVSVALGVDVTPPTVASAVIPANGSAVNVTLSDASGMFLPQAPSTMYGLAVYDGAVLAGTGTVTSTGPLTFSIPFNVNAQAGHTYTLKYPFDNGTHGSDANSIAQFEQPPMSDIVTSATVSVIADQFNGIHDVTFTTDHGTVNGGASAVVTTKSTNSSTPANPKDSTRFSTYCCTVDETGVAANTTVTVTAVVHPNSGGPAKTITNTFLANPSRPAYHVKCTSGSDTTGDGSAGNPWQTLLKATLVDGSADVYLDEAGNYPFYSRSVGYRTSNGYWMHVRLGSGMTQSGVVIQKLDNSDMRADRIAYHGMTIYIDPGTNFTTGSATYPYTWIDNCDVHSTLTVSNYSTLQTYFNDINTGAGHYWITGGRTHDMPYDAYTLPHAIGVEIQNCYAHGINSPQLVDNVWIDNIDTRPGVDDHVDGIFWYNPNSSSNGITCNVDLTNINGLLIFGDQPDSDMLVSGVTGTARDGGVNGLCQFGKGQTYRESNSNEIFRNITLTNQALVFIQDSFVTWHDTLIDTGSFTTTFSAPDPNIQYDSITVGGSGIPNQTVVDHPANITDSAFVPNALGTVNMTITNNVVAASPSPSRIQIGIGIGL